MILSVGSLVCMHEMNYISVRLLEDVQWNFIKKVYHICDYLWYYVIMGAVTSIPKVATNDGKRPFI